MDEDELILHNRMNPIDTEDEGVSGTVALEDPKDRIQGIVQRSLERAIDFYHENLEPIQEEATDYYHGRPFGDEEEGRSQVVSTDVRDTTLAQLPGLLRTFFSAENPVKFRPRGPEDEELAQQQTDYIQWLITEENDGFLTFHAVFKDALVRKLGIIKWFQDEFYRVEQTELTGLDEETALAIFDREDVQDVEITGQYAVGGVLFYNLQVTHRKRYGCPKFCAIPNEEFVFSPGARSLEDAPLVAHVREVPLEEVIALGVDPDLVEEKKGTVRHTHGDSLRDAREFHDGASWPDSERETGEVDPSQELIVYAEAYALVDGDGDDISELRLFQCIGPDFTIVNGDGLGEVVDDLPFAVFTPDPEPHTVIGLGNWDLLNDIQRIKSQVLRGTLNSLAASIEPQLGVVTGEVNMQDILNPEINKVIRMNRPGMIQEVKHTFIGPEALSVMEYADQVKEDRTGQMRGAPGIDADALQSSTKAAVSAVVTGVRERAELLARVFAETGMKRFYKGLYRLTVKHQDQPKVVRLRGKWVKIDPASWEADADVIVDLPLGAGTTEERIAILGNVLAMQKEFMAAGSPLVTWVEIRNTLGKFLELAGQKFADQFFRPWGPEEQMQMEQQMAQQPPQPDPQQMIIQVEQAKLQLDALKEERKLELEERKIQLQDDREREKIARDAALKEKELELKHAIEIEDAKLRARIEEERLAMEKNNTPTTAE